MSGYTHVLAAEGGHYQKAITFASGGVGTTTTAHGLVVGQEVALNSLAGASPLVIGTVYFVKTVPTSTTLTLAATAGGTEISTASGSGLLCAQTGWSTNTPPGTTGTELPQFFSAGPNGWHQMYSRLTFLVSVLGLYNPSGASVTAWSLKAQLQYGLKHTLGYGWQFPAWGPLDAFEMAGCVAEKAGFAGGSHPVPTDGALGIIADQSDAGGGLALPSTVAFQPVASGSVPITANATQRVTVRRTVTDLKNGVRLAVTPSITGGDSLTRILGTVIVAGKKD
jgi:hypothetical protein